MKSCNQHNVLNSSKLNNLQVDKIHNFLQYWQNQHKIQLGNFIHKKIIDSKSILSSSSNIWMHPLSCIIHNSSLNSKIQLTHLYSILNRMFNNLNYLNTQHIFAMYIFNSWQETKCYQHTFHQGKTRQSHIYTNFHFHHSINKNQNCKNRMLNH